MNSFLRDCGEEALPWWAELALWRGFAFLFGPGGRERIGSEFASLKFTVAAAVGAKTKPEDHMLYRFPDLSDKSREAATMDAYWALRKIAVKGKPEKSG